MKNWIGIIIYIILIGVITFFVAQFTEAEKVTNYLVDQQAQLLVDNPRLIQASQTANLNDGSVTYVKKTPLYQEHFIRTNDASVLYALDVYIYAFASLKDNVGTNYFAIIIKNLQINDELYVANDEGSYEVNMNITFNQNIQYGNLNASSFEEVFVTTFNETQKIIFINYDRLEATHPVEIKSIDIYYWDINNQSTLLVDLDNTNLTPLTQGDVFNDTFNRDIAYVNSEQLKLYQSVGHQYENNVNIFFDNQQNERLNSYNIYYVRNIAIELIIVLPLTYFIFFHKYVWARYKEKKILKKEKDQVKYDLIKAEIKKKDAGK